MNKPGDLIPQAALKLANDRMRSAIDSGKYEEWDWMTDPYTRQEVIDKIGRHYVKRDNGHTEDEHGSHAAAIVCNGLILLTYEIEGIDFHRGVVPDTSLGEGVKVGRRCECEQADSVASESGDCDKG